MAGLQEENLALWMPVERGKRAYAGPTGSTPVKGKLRSSRTLSVAASRSDEEGECVD